MGLGRSVSIFRDLWLPRLSLFHHITPTNENTADWMVEDFINNKDWDRMIINNIFFPVDHEVIYSIPSSHSAYSDNLIWHYDPKELYGAFGLSLGNGDV